MSIPTPWGSGVYIIYIYMFTSKAQFGTPDDVFVLLTGLHRGAWPTAVELGRSLQEYLTVRRRRPLVLAVSKGFLTKTLVLVEPLGHRA